MPKPNSRPRAAKRRSETDPKPKPMVVRSESGKRLLQVPKRIWYNPLSWRHRPPAPDYPPLPKARLLFWRVLRQLWAHKALFGGITVLYGVLNLMLVRGLSDGSNLASYKATLDHLFNGSGNQLGSSVLSFMYLLSTAGGGSSSSAGVYQGILLLTCSLAFIWAFRQVLAGNEIKVRDSFYRGMYPLVPFLLISSLIGLQLLPLALGRDFYSIMIGSGIAIDFWEKTVVLLIFLALALWSIRMVTASAFALYIVTLPDMTPLRAYRTARQLVHRRRLLLWRKFIFLPITLLVLAAIVEVPLIFFLTPLAAWTFFIFGMIALPLVHGYVYTMYREMI